MAAALSLALLTRVVSLLHSTEVDLVTGPFIQDLPAKIISFTLLLLKSKILSSNVLDEEVEEGNSVAGRLTGVSKTLGLIPQHYKKMHTFICLNL